MSGRPAILAIVGPTCTGKTELACALARRIDAEILSADSMQLYRYMDVGTAKPPEALRAEIPHHLIDVVDPDEPMSAGHYAELARRAAAEIRGRGRPVLLCGGSGLYARAFTGGLIPDVGADPEIRAEIAERATDDLLAELRSRDPESAARIPPGDRVRLERALEILYLGGRSASVLHAEHAFGDRPFDVHWLALDCEREVLWRAIEARVDRMFDEGLVDEVRALGARGYTRALRPLNAIGYREVGLLLEGVLDEPTARERIVVATRRYAKRQRTWFRAEKDVRWLDAESRGPLLEATLRAAERAFG